MTWGYLELWSNYGKIEGQMTNELILAGQVWFTKDLALLVPRPVPKGRHNSGGRLSAEGEAIGGPVRVPWKDSI